jgi:hypothetical protein
VRFGGRVSMVREMGSRTMDRRVVPG